MNKHCVRWKPVRCKAIRGPDVAVLIATGIDIRYRGTLLSRILAMPEKNPISFDDAIRMVSSKQNEAYLEERFGTKPGQYGWYAENFVAWISELGFHIVITGDEFEVSSLSDILS